MRAIVLVALIAVAAPAVAQFTPPLGPDHAVSGPRTRMYTLASAHLSGYSDRWSKSWLEPLVQQLSAWKPGLITVEQLSGTQCEVLRANPVVFGEAFDSYCRDASDYQRSLRLTQAQAVAEVERTLAQWPAKPTSIQRRRLAMHFMAAGDFPSAMVQWLRLPEPERRAADGLSEGAVKFLSRPTGRMNETYEIAAEVAARVGLERVHSVDDHTSDAIDFAADPAFGPWQQARQDAIRASGLMRQINEADASVRDGASLLAYYRAMNAPGAMNALIEADFGGSVADRHPKQFGRKYAGWWETRNLRMVANIREAITLHPGVRVLNVVGASHKPWYDQWARQMSDVEVAASAEVLGP